MTIHLYTIGWNEMAMLGFFFRHYEPWVDRFVFFDDGSNDGTVEYLQSKPNVEVRRFQYAHPESFSLSAKPVRDHCWKESRGVADWVILTDVDEHIYHPQLEAYLRECKHRGITYMPTLGFDMVTDEFPGQNEYLARTRTLGAPNHSYSKMRILDPDAIEEINFDIGCHTASPLGRVVLPEKDELLLLHYKQLGTNYVMSRHAALGQRLRERDVANRWGYQFFHSPEEQERTVANLKSNLVDITDSNYLPWRDHHEARWWRPELRPADGSPPQ